MLSLEDQFGFHKPHHFTQDRSSFINANFLAQVISSIPLPAQSPAPRSGNAVILDLCKAASRAICRIGLKKLMLFVRFSLQLEVLGIKCFIFLKGNPKVKKEKNHNPNIKVYLQVFYL